MSQLSLPPGFQDMLSFGFIEALLGRRSRRFFMGAEIPEGVFAFKSRRQPVPLSELEKILVLSAVGSNTGWQYLIPYNDRYAPYLPNYASAPGGRTFPSAAGFQVSEVFFTDDEGVYMLQTGEAPDLKEMKRDGSLDLAAMIENQRSRIRKLAEGRLHLPSRDPHIESHNRWVVNRPGSLFIFPAADVALHNLLNLCYYLQNGCCLYDDIHREKIEGLEKFKHMYKHMYDPDSLLPLSFIERYSLTEATTELVTSCYAGALMLQAMGLGGWMFNGANPYSILGASRDPEVPGLGFRFDQQEDWAVPNVTGLPGVFEGHCPPHFPDMKGAIESVISKKFGPGGPFHSRTPGPWKDSVKVRGSTQVHNEEFKACIAVQAEYILEHFGKFPGTVPTILMFTYLQAHHIDLDFYDRYFEPGACLKTHEVHMDHWHPEVNAGQMEE
jgi:hypothetical protein